MKKKKILGLALAGMTALTGGFMLAGCDVTDNKDNTQTEQEQQKEVASISIKQDSVPSYIIKEHFSRTNVKLNVTYADDTTGVVDVTESMLDDTSKEEIKQVGQYNLTINYGGKTATMYANVVDERYLLKEVVEANLDKDVTITCNGVVGQLDVNNKIMHATDGEDYTSWIWINNNICYEYESEDGVNKGLASNFYEIAYNSQTMMVFDILNGVDEDGIAWTVDSIEKDGLNYILTATQGDDCQYKYYFNEDFMYKVEEIDGGYTSITNYNYSIVNLEVPTEIKALESSATINVIDRTSDLKDLMNDYLESDFEMNIFDASTDGIFGTTRYDADKNIMHIEDIEGYEWNWVSGDYYYSKEIDSDIYKFDISGWQGWVEEGMFGEIDLYSTECSADISEDGQYYELVLTFEEDSDGEVWEYKYIFNNEEIARIDVKCDGQYMGYYTYNKTNIVLEVPADIKALESSAQ